MAALWFGVLTFMLAMYVMLDGRNFGIGILHFVVARERRERRQVIAAIGPLWLWHEVWLVGTGGVLFVAFPKLLASAFAGYYLALFLILWCAILRGVAIEVGGHIDEPLWQSFWDAVFFLSSALLAILFGAALGNVLRGVPVEPDGTFHMAFWSDFETTGKVGLLDWYTVSVAVFAALVLAAHGATYLADRTEGAVHDRALRVAQRLWASSVPAFVAISSVTWKVRPELFAGIARRPLAWVGVLVCLASGAVLAHGLFRDREDRAFKASSTLIATVLGTGAAALYPTILSSTLDRADSLTVERVIAPASGLASAILWWPLAALLSFAYFFLIRRYYRGKVSVDRDNQGLY